VVFSISLGIGLTDVKGPVLISVLSTRPTSQAMMVFAKLAPPTEVDEASPAISN
jgi:hypothetical protein